MTCAATALAAPQRLEFPWERRAAGCHEATPPAGLDCGLASWPDEDQSSYYIAALLTSGRYALLEEALESITRSNETYASGRPVAVAVRRGFFEAFPARELRGDESEWIARWKSEIPDSRFVLMAEAYLLVQRGWNVRGTGFSDSVSRESWDIFHKRMREAQVVLDKVPAAERNAVWYEISLGASLDADRPAREPMVIMEEAVQRWPAYYPFYERIVQRLVPKWGGSWREVRAFIGKWSDRREPADGKSLYARLYIALRSDGSFQEMRIDWPRMKEGLAELTARYPDPRYRNLFASYACAARDKDAYSKAMMLLPKSQINPKDWLTGHSPEACSRWALTEV